MMCMGSQVILSFVYSISTYIIGAYVVCMLFGVLPHV